MENPELSALLRKPLAVSQGGVGHYGGASFATTNDRGFQAIRAWIELEDRGGEDPEPLGEFEQLFADTVQAVLAAATCMTSRCHGPDSGAIPFKLDPGFQGSWSAAATRHNYEETLAQLSLDGFPRRSRVVRKSLALGAGTLHKGTNFDFYRGGPGGGVDAIVRWACAERRARAGVECPDEDDAPLSGLVFVRGPIAPHHPFQLDEFTPGSDLWQATISDASLLPGALENLTAALHPDGPADVRDPAVSRDGTKVLLTMRRSADEGHHLWLLELATRAARQLTFGNVALPGGGVATDRDPTFGPDDSIWFASTRAGVVADQGQLQDADLYTLNIATNETRRWTHTPHLERKPVFFDVGAEAGGEVAFSALRDALPGQTRAHIFRFPPSLSTEYHQHFGVTPSATLLFDMRELPDGRYLAIQGELSTRFEAGALVVVDRNFGPEINEHSASTIPALERYEPPLVVVADEGAFRDPAPLGDGRLLVAHAPAPIDVNDEAATFVSRIELFALDEARDGSGPVVLERVVLLEEPGVALSDPEPLWVRAPIRAEPALAPSDQDTAVFRHQGLPMIDALLGNLAPAGTKQPLAGVARVRLIEHLPLTPQARAATAMGTHGPARILAELPVEADGSFQARVPAGIAFRLQSLDEQGMAIGAMHNRWYSALPGQVITQGISSANGTARYGSLCAACHGDPSGTARAPALESPDTITSASLSLARFDRQNPRRPIEPPLLGDATRVEVDFSRDLAPILEARCVRCHDEGATLDLSSTPTKRFTRAYESLLAPGPRSGSGRDLVDDGEGRAHTSFLVELLLGRELDAPGSLALPLQPHPGVREEDGPLEPDEVAMLVRWIELGATFVGLPTNARGAP
ncbi:MAG: hypothetical protein IT382_16380 [Deltaproteobacteria bacterium]|nr:hypothetical protein [Deltaproteobacteria bacterium]